MDAVIRKLLAVMLAVSMIFSFVTITALADGAPLFFEDFELGSLPDGWTTDATSDSEGWSVGTGDANPGTGAASGSFNARVTHRTTLSKAGLITPQIVLPEENIFAKLNFCLVNRNWAGDVDQLTVYTRVNEGAWQKIFSTGEAHESWTQQSLSVPYMLNGDTIQFRFEMTDFYGYGVGIDDVELVRAESSTSYSVTYYANDGSGDSFTMTDVPADSAVFLPEGNIFGTDRYLISWNSSADGMGTTYYPGEYFVVTDNISLYARFAPEGAIIEGFEGGSIPSGWTTDGTSPEYSWDVGVGGYDTSPGTHSGAYNARLVSPEDDSALAWLITPVMNFGNRLSGALRFWYFSAPYDDDIDYFGVYYRVNGGAWNELFYTEEAQPEWTLMEIPFPDGMLADNVEIGFMGEGHYSNGIMIDDVIIASYDKAMPKAEMFEVTLPSGIKVCDGTDYALLVSFAVADEYQDLMPEVELTLWKGGVQVTEAIDVGTYTVKISVPENDNFMSATIADPAWTFFVLTTQYFCSFDEPGDLEGWTFIDADGDGINWFVFTDDTGGNYCHSTPNVLTSASYDNIVGELTPDNWAITPPVLVRSTSTLSFWFLAQDVLWAGDKVGVYIGDSPDPDQMVFLCDFYTDDTYLPHEVDISDYEGIKYIGFRHYDSVDIFRCNIDDVSVAAHQHGRFTYEAVNDTIVATCGVNNCPVPQGFPLILRLPDVQNDVFEATLYDYNRLAFPSVEITYRGVEGTEYEESAIPPVGHGSYEVCLSAGGVTVTKTYNITKYSVVVLDSEFGTVTADAVSASPGEIVWLDAVPAQGYEFAGFTLYYGVSEIFSEESSFAMPPYDVLVEPLFVPLTKPVFRAHTLLLSGQIGVMFRVDLSMLSAEELADSFMEFTINGLTTTVPTADAENVAPGQYRFTCFVNALQMAENIDAAFKYVREGDTLAVYDVYSVEDYVDYVESNEEEFTPATVDLVYALADYGHYAQLYLTELNNIPADKYAAMNTYFSSIYDTGAILTNLSGCELILDNEQSQVAGAQMRLRLDAETALSVRLQVPEGVGLTATATFHGKTFTAVAASDGYYVITVPGITALQFADEILIEGDADGSFSVSTSVLAYVRAMLAASGTTDKAANAMAALYIYHLAADEYALSMS
ncbi:MAG: choice-of-anchor J domain-containing protein [Clostridia bacterium]|nr:choice-of-anchor J domain-containing protein [Clostridia bacterium]